LTGSCFLGAIFGTGTNGAYVEDLGAVTKLKKKSNLDASTGKMIINTEWGAFDNAVGLFSSLGPCHSILINHSKKFSVTYFLSHDGIIL
jgi:hypothetical protein